ncbi:MAG: carbohydrate ABC transporter permease [Spirochaetales bacterium]|nr:carbohydrate ABC transporter permease [Spirochaetales bacterium]MBQ5391186.1 carbohydrate ABC transporter permease [Spirochaetales bacterium]MBQ6124827.1 carbohydrate ABC transporter permease [Spirochaetales bacterium]MBQ7729935.1 carbohydrate ABC transporter permease [Spirochaetales bacterium]MBR6235306.1 carbohydrate ABC transporter permease [Spirochaetales bacterium]
MRKVKRVSRPLVVLMYAVCIFFAILSLLPFVIMIINSTRNTYQVQQHALSFLPSKYLLDNLKILTSKDIFHPLVGFLNSFIISAGTTACAIYFSTLTAYAIVAYQWKLRNAFFTFILAVMMIPAQVTSIGFYQMVYRVHMTNNFLPLILPAIASPSMVFFMRQYMIPSLPMEIIESARVDGCREFRIFNQIVIPMVKPAMATQGIFCFVASWNQLFLPQILLTNKKRYTMPIMVSLLKGDIYKTEYGAVYLGLALTVLPLFVVYFLLSKYIIAGVALGGVKG